MLERKVGAGEKKAQNSMQGAVVRIVGGKGSGLMWKRWTPSIIVPRVFLNGM
jgi:hypothetical protein